MDWINRGQFDELIEATAVIVGMPLLTSDAQFAALDGLTKIWWSTPKLQPATHPGPGLLLAR